MIEVAFEERISRCTRKVSCSDGGVYEDDDSMKGIIDRARWSLSASITDTVCNPNIINAHSASYLSW